MADYNLAGLSTRSFEQLIQAIAIKLIGPGVVIFGDGPDGGREATFEGVIPYPSEKNSWRGYGVIQAKFRQRPQNTQQDAEWALQQLRSELNKFTDPEKNLRKPDYYILATNVVLTPVQDKGSKDKAEAIFEAFKDTLPLKGHDIWDHDKIRAFLDGAEDIRRGYAAWITPGDVLSQVIERIAPRQPDFDRTITNFLQKELLADQDARLVQAGHANEDRIPLARVFVDLPAFDERRGSPPDEKRSSERLPAGFVSKVLQIAAERLDPETVRVHAAQPRIEEGIKKPEPGRFVLIGGPGQGKTTVSQFICQLFRAAILHDKLSSLPPDVRRALDTIASQCESEDIHCPSVRRFPLRIVLNEFATALASGRSHSLLAYVVERIRLRTDREIAVEDFRQWLAAYPWILVLDGLDEVPSSSNRDEILNAVRDFWIDAYERNADVLVVATTRPQGYNQDFSPELYHHQWLAPLSTARAMHYAQRLANARYGNNADRKDRILSRLERASHHEATARLMQSPLQVTIMTTLVDQRGHPPQERWNLFQEYYDVIYRRERERDIPAAGILRDYKPDIDAIHSRVGLLLQVETERSGRTDARLSTRRFESLVEGRLHEEAYKGDTLQTLQTQIIEAATNRLVFLVGLEQDAIGFEIRSLQEFMAAEALMEGDDTVICERLQEIAPIANWRNVFLFAAGKCFTERQYLRDTIHTICAELNESDKDEIARATLAGSRLALDLLEDGPARRQPKYVQLLTRLALRLMDLPPAEAHIRLADVREPERDRIYREELERRLAQRTVEQRLGAWTTLLALIAQELPWAEELGETYWPSHADEQFHILEGGYQLQRQESKWIFKKIIDYIPNISPVSPKPSILWNSLRNTSRQLEKPLWYDIATRILDYFEGISTKPISISLNLDKEKRLILVLYSALLSEKYYLASLKELSSPDSEWTPMITATKFVENPSSLTLAQALRAFAQVYTPNYSKRLGRLSWLLAVCLNEADGQEQLLEMATRAEAGEFGDFSDWQLAEKRWRDHGVTMEDIDYMRYEHRPLHKDIARIGFPLSAVDSLRPSNLNTKSLLDLYASQTYYPINTYISNRIILSLLFELVTGKNDMICLSQLEMRLLIRDLAPHQPFPLDLFNKLNIKEWGISFEEEWLTTFNAIGSHPELYLHKTLDPEPFTSLSHAFQSHPTYTGILRILSFCAIEGQHTSISPDLLSPEKFDDPMFRKTAILARLAQADWNDDEAVRLAQHVAALVPGHPEVGIHALQTIKSNEPPAPVADRFLLELHRKLPATQWKTIQHVVADINDSLQRRTSRLGTLDTWSKLRLSEGLSSLIH